MTWGESKFTAATAAERGAAIRAEREAEANYVRRRQEEMSRREKSPTGIVRGEYKFEEAQSGVGSLNRKVDAAIDEVAKAFERERQMADTARSSRQDASRRAPILDGKRAVR